MTIRRKVAKVKVKVRKYQRAQEQKKLKKLALERNKHLREAAKSARMAKAKEEVRTAQLKSMKAKGIEPRKSRVKCRTTSAKKAGRKVVKTLKDIQKFARKHSNV
jgi:hypothetical protein